jgi:RNA binding exosome subunit
MKVERIVVSAMVHSTENREKVAEAMATLFPFEFEIVSFPAKGHFGNPIEYLEVEITKRKQIKDFWNYFMELLGEQKIFVLNTIENRIDDEGFFYIRVDKQKAYLGEVELTEGGDAIVVKAKLVTYPRRKEKLVEFARELVEKGYK